MRARRPPGNGRQGGRGPVPSRALDPSSPLGSPTSLPTRSPARPTLSPKLRAVSRSGLGVLSPPTASSLLEPASGCGMSRRDWGPVDCRALGGPPDMARSARDAPAAAAASFYGPPPRAPPAPRPRPRSNGGPAPAGSGAAATATRRLRLPAPRWAGLLRSEPRRAPPLGTRACERTRPRGARRSREGEEEAEGRGERGRGGKGEAVSLVPARRPAGSAPPALCGGRAGVQAPYPGGRPLGVCAQTPELMFNGNQRWKQTLEDPVLFQPRLLLRPGAATLGAGAGALGTRT